MSTTPQSILKKYWGYDSFRDKQLDIINHCLNGEDVLALLPTGGGKSICFQVTAMCQDGICVVVSPLISLMKDQVENLKSKGINAVALHSGMHRTQIDAELDNCVYGDVKFLYLSPERLRTEIVQVRLQKMNVNLLAVDEAHCISQWGYDFRPPYLEIANIRELLPGVPVIALTATATPNVVEDIQEKLHFKRKCIVQKSFSRPNLSYLIEKPQDVKGRLLSIIQKTAGSAVVYVRSRRRTREIANFLQTQGIAASHYHAGLSFDERLEKQQEWISDKTRVIVATNAFGMGIDKPNVRLVAHIGFPDNLESYFQEAGRAGRDEKNAFCVALVAKADIAELEKRRDSEFPSRERIKDIYYALGSNFQLAEGSGTDEWFNLDVSEFANRYNWKPKEILTAISFLEKSDHLLLTASSETRSTFKISVDKDTLYQIELRNPKVGKLIKILMRSYGRLFEEHVPINEKLVAKRVGYSLKQVIATLEKLHKINVAEYKPATQLPQLTFVGGRVRKQDILISKSIYEDRIKLIQQRISAAIHFVSTEHVCRSQMLLKYFGETESKHCGKCDVCRKLSKAESASVSKENILSSIKSETSIESIVQSISGNSETDVLKTIQEMLDNNELVYAMNGKVTLPKA